MKEEFAKKLFPFALFCFLLVVFFGKSLIGLSIPLEGDFSGSDLLDLHYPYKCALEQSFEEKFLPLWTPYLDGGYPLFAEGQMGAFYPPNIILSWLFSPIITLNYSILLAILLAQVFAYLYARSLKLSEFPSTVAAIIFGFSAFFIVRIKHINIINVAAFLPLGLWCIRKFFSTTQFKFVALLGITIGVQFLAGHPQMTLYCLLIYLWGSLFESFLQFKLNKTLSIGKLTICIIPATILGIGLGAVQILPTFEMTQLSPRPAYIFEQIVMYPWHPKNLLTLVSPYFFGNPALGTYRENIRQMGIFWENASYAGILSLVSIFVAIFLVIKQRKKLQPKIYYLILFFLLSTLLSLLLMSGKYSPVFSLLLKLIPFTELFRFPTRFNLLFTLSVAMLTGLSTEYLIGKLREENRFSSRWPLSLLRTKILIIFVIFIDLFVFGKNFVGEMPKDLWQKTPESVEFLKEDESIYRIYSTSQYGESPYQTFGWKQNLEPLVAIREAIPPNSNICYQISSISDRGWFEGGLPLTRHYQFEKWLLNEVSQDEFKTGKILGLFNVKYILAFSETQNPEFVLKKEIDLGESFAVSLKIYENLQNMPRTFFVPEAKVVPNLNKLLEEMSDFQFHPVRTVILEEEPPFTPPTFGGALDDFKKDNPVEIVSYKPLEVQIKADIKNEGFLVLSDTPYPGWKASVNGKPTEIYTANFLQRAIPLQPGSYEIKFIYDPLFFKIGAIISATSLGILLLIPLSCFIVRKIKR